VAPAIANDPAFKDVHLSQVTGHGGVWITGNVPTIVDKNRLKELVTRMFGERRAEDLLRVSANDENR
jgi:uncharacterized protein (DUF2336 family)